MHCIETLPNEVGEAKDDDAYSKIIFEFHNNLDLLSPPIGLKTCSNSIWNTSDQFHEKIRKVSLCCSRSRKYPDLDHLQGWRP